MHLAPHEHNGEHFPEFRLWLLRQLALTPEALSVNIHSILQELALRPTLNSQLQLTIRLLLCLPTPTHHLLTDINNRVVNRTLGHLDIPCHTNEHLSQLDIMLHILEPVTHTVVLRTVMSMMASKGNEEEIFPRKQRIN